MSISSHQFHEIPRSGGLRVGPNVAILEVLREFGVEPERILTVVGLTASDFDDPEQVISLEARGRLLAACARETGCPHFGLLVGQRRNVSSLGAVGFLLSHAPDVRRALADLVANLHLNNRMAAPYLEVTDQVTIFGFEMLGPILEGAVQVDDGALALGFNIMRGLCGAGWLPSEVRLRRMRPKDVAVYQRFFQAPVVFNAEQTALIFPTYWLERKVQSADPALRDYLGRQVAAMRSYGNDSLEAQVGRVLIGLLGTKRCSLEGLAVALDVHPRTLNRRLKASGTSFRELYESARHNLALKLLRDTRSSIQNIALALNYSGGNAFGRAFTQWEGVPPATWRRRMWAGFNQESGFGDSIP